MNRIAGNASHERVAGAGGAAEPPVSNVERRRTGASLRSSPGHPLARALAVIAVATLIAAALRHPAAADDPQPAKAVAAAASGDASVVPDAKQVGGEPDGIVQVANLVYATNKSSH